MLNIPNILTLSRILAIPIIVITFHIPSSLGIWLSFGVFIIASVTDFLDGWLARKLNQTSEFGRALDPIADKLLVATVLILLLSNNQAPIIAVIAILTREILIAGLRESLAGKLVIPVSNLSKLKTTTQLIALGVILISPEFSNEIDSAIYLAGKTAIWLVVVLTWLTAIPYITTAWHNYNNKDNS